MISSEHRESWGEKKENYWELDADQLSSFTADLVTKSSHQDFLLPLNKSELNVAFLQNSLPAVEEATSVGWNVGLSHPHLPPTTPLGRGHEESFQLLPLSLRSVLSPIKLIIPSFTQTSDGKSGRKDSTIQEYHRYYHRYVWGLTLWTSTVWAICLYHSSTNSSNQSIIVIIVIKFITNIRAYV